MAKKATESTALRVVGTRTIPKPIASDDWPVAMTDDEYDAHVDALEAEGDEDNHEGAKLARIARLTSTIEHMSPSSFSTFTLLRDAIPADIRERIAAGHKLCLIANLPAKFWIDPCQTALSLTLEELAIATDAAHAQVAVRGIDRGYSRTPAFDVDDIVSTLNRQHVIVPVLPGETLDCTLLALADLKLPLGPTAETLLAAVRRRFSDTDDWPESLMPAHVRPASLDLACQRGVSAAHAFELLERISASIAEQERTKENERQEAEAKTTVTKTKTAAISPTYPTSPRLEGLHGYGSIAKWARDLCEDLAAYNRGDLAWADVDTGCLIYGPPGTGKTLFASALAASSGLPFFATSFAQWQGTKGGHLGDIVTAMRAWFAAASMLSPAILFIDEFDSIPARGASAEHDDYWRPIVNALLELLDGTARREGLVVIAACNYPDKIDAAITRSGRLDRRFELGLPDEEDLARIFCHHMPDLSVDVIAPVATVLAGSCSGADAARISREARRVARRAKRDLVAEDLLSIAMPPDTRSPADRRLVAVHEAGHAIAMLAVGRVPDALSIVAGGGTHGGVRLEPDFGMGRLGEIEAEVVTLLAGRAAEEIILGEPSAGAGNDLEKATSLVKRTLGVAGLGGRLTHDEQVSGTEVESRLRDLYGRALRLVGQHRSAVEALADLALEKRVLARRALADFGSERGLGGGAR